MFAYMVCVSARSVLMNYSEKAAANTGEMRLERYVRDGAVVFYLKNRYLWSPYVIGQTIIFSSCFFFILLLLLLSFFSSPNLSGRRLDVYHTLAHGVALVRI